MTRKLLWLALLGFSFLPARSEAEAPAKRAQIQIQLDVVIAEVNSDAKGFLDLPACARRGEEKGCGVLKADETKQVREALDRLRKSGQCKILARPSIVTLSGRPASFLAGGELPITAPAGSGQVGVQFEEFGTRLNCLPILVANGKVNLELEIEQSSLLAVSTKQATPGREIFRVNATTVLSAGESLILLQDAESDEATRKRQPTKGIRIALVVPTLIGHPVNALLQATHVELLSKPQTMPKPRATVWPLNVEAVAGQVRVCCQFFEATADRLEQDSDGIILAGKARLLRRGEAGGVATEVTAEQLSIRFEDGHLRLRTDGKGR